MKSTILNTVISISVGTEVLVKLMEQLAKLAEAVEERLALVPGEMIVWSVRLGEPLLDEGHLFTGTVSRTHPATLAPGTLVPQDAGAAKLASVRVASAACEPVFVGQNGYRKYGVGWERCTASELADAVAAVLSAPSDLRQNGTTKFFY